MSVANAMIPIFIRRLSYSWVGPSYLVTKRIRYHVSTYPNKCNSRSKVDSFTPEKQEKKDAIKMLGLFAFVWIRGMFR